MIIVSRILFPKLDRQINVANHIKNQRQHLSRLATVMFRGAPCTWEVAACKIAHLEKCPWEVATCKNAFGNVPKIFLQPYQANLEIVNIYYLAKCHFVVFLLPSLDQNGEKIFV